MNRLHWLWILLVAAIFVQRGWYMSFHEENVGDDFFGFRYYGGWTSIFISSVFRLNWQFCRNLSCFQRCPWNICIAREK